ncbi:N-acetyltransferase [Rhodobacteraceae bacterium RKSG542]|nr:N-acetyltransferase [Pseudovibrio flavus]
MRPSLEAAGLFDPVRVRERLLETYSPQDTYLIVDGDALVGFYVLRKREDHLLLDHLYIKGEYQGRGVGQMVVKAVQEAAKAEHMEVRLRALISSPANAFYRSCGFRFVSADDADNYYSWSSEDAVCGSS